jgi:hypothetical protein
MSDQKNIRIQLKNGMMLRVPKQSVETVVMPGILVKDSYHRLVLIMDDYDKMLEELRKKFSMF